MLVLRLAAKPRQPERLRIDTEHGPVLVTLVCKKRRLCYEVDKPRAVRVQLVTEESLTPPPTIG